MPKQFIKFFDNKSFFQLTLERNLQCAEKTLVVLNTEQYFLALDQVAEIDKKCNFLLEPLAKNTAPAIALACLTLPLDEIVLVTPSDHLIKDVKAYQEAVSKAQTFAKEGFLVTFGIIPQYPETGFGYIKMGENFQVESFYEKPNLSQAQEYCQSKNFLWNAGIFCFKVETLLQEMQKYCPEILSKSQKALETAKREENLIRIDFDSMKEIEEQSIDYAVMEKSKICKVIPSQMSWSDVGSFDALYQELEKDEQGNAILAHCMSLDSHHNLIISHNQNKLISLVGMQDCIVIDTGDALIVSKRGQSQRIKEIVKALGDNEICKTHLTTHRPWGTYTILEDSQGYKLKKIVVKPGKRLSLQKHFHRNEHWIVVSGTATVRVGDETKLVRPNESTYIKMGEVHRLSNEGKIPVVLIEAQVGEYTQEDDIIRFNDDFGRE